MLHLIFQSPLQTATLQRIAEGDAVLFLESATLHLLKNSLQCSELQQLLTSNHLFVLISDIETRGISSAELMTGITVIDYAEWVNLTTEYQVIQSWF
jgi:tRNA 2-thiouridine synthesizing protein B